MKSLISLIVFVPHLVAAHCPTLVTAAGQDYCLALDWQAGEKKVQGQFEPIEEVTPYLNLMGTVPQKWVYSKVAIVPWQKGDKNHAPVEIPNFRVFPYMHMQNGHNHSAGYEFFYDAVEGVYLLQSVAFQQMPGCWSLRWTIEDQDLEESSELLMNLTEFVNLDDDQVAQQETFCQSLGANLEGGGEGGAHQHHH